MRAIVAGVGVALATAGAGLQAELPVKNVLTLEMARAATGAAREEALKRGATVVIAVVDDGGHVVSLERLNDTQVASVEVGIGKARTAAIFRRPSKVFEDQIRDGRVAALALPGATPLQGGLPLTVNGQVVGAIGVSGNTPQEDEDIARAGAAAFDRAISGSRAAAAGAATIGTFIPAANVRAAFDKGMPLIETDGFKIHASRREAPGMAEIHDRDTDIIYVLEGTATIVTGGEAVNAKPIGPDELRGTSVAGGTARQLSKGDVLVVPNGMPHQFTETSKPFLYYVVKATAHKMEGSR